MPGEFKDKIVVISGASRGIGRGIALAFAREGAQTVLASSSEQNLAAAAKAIATEGPQPFTVAGDLRTPRHASNCSTASTNASSAAMCSSTMRARRARARSWNCPMRSGSTASP
jgi:NAD(P)-dependent dehydrogenase (short-subunit alcohol dehydrogenase family)